MESWAAFEKGLIDEFPQVVATINQHIDATFEVSTCSLFRCTMIKGQLVVFKRMMEVKPSSKGDGFGIDKSLVPFVLFHCL